MNEYHQCLDSRYAHRLVINMILRSRIKVYLTFPILTIMETAPIILKTSLSDFHVLFIILFQVKQKTCQVVAMGRRATATYTACCRLTKRKYFAHPPWRELSSEYILLFLV